ncbi:MAG: energy transducer TonB [Verrucomicrobia bacterium]|nr:energy transducer TonB [Verrucomicrobiota bacterium]
MGPPQAEDVVREFKSDVWMATITPDVITPNAAVVFDHLPPMRMAPGIGPGAGPGGGVESVDGLDRVPRTRLQASPVYPYEARKDGRGGEVIVAFTVDEQGRVVNPVVVRSTDPAFEGPTLRAVARWRFEPGRKNGRVVRFRLAVPVQFALNENQ